MFKPLQGMFGFIVSDAEIQRDVLVPYGYVS